MNTLEDYLIRTLKAVRDLDVASEAVRQARLTFVNWLGCCLGAAKLPETTKLINGLKSIYTFGISSPFGRGESLPLPEVALVNGFSSHLLDYDDTHLATVIHPGGPVCAAACAAGTAFADVSLNDFYRAIVVGVEVECKIGRLLYPKHYLKGWHITGTAGIFGAAIASGLLLRLTSAEHRAAVAIAASQPIGLRSQFGTMMKPMHPGLAARVGYQSAALAKHGLTGSPLPLTAPSGYLAVLDASVANPEIPGDDSATYEIEHNAFKPYACGIVLHPIIDACIALRMQMGLRLTSVSRVLVSAHPLVLELTGKREPTTGLESKFSVYHACAVSLRTGEGGTFAFSDEAALDPENISLREKVIVEIHETYGKAEAKVRVEMLDGSCLTSHVTSPLGSAGNPMTTELVRQKFLAQASPYFDETKLSEILEIALNGDLNTPLHIMLEPLLLL